MIIANYHLLLFISNIAFVSNVGACEWVIARDHYDSDFSLLQLFDGCLRLGLQFVFEDLKACEKEVGFRLVPRNLFDVPLSLLIGDCQHSEAVRSVLFEFGFVVRRNAAFLHNFVHDLGRTFGVDIVFDLIADCHFADDAHPLHVGVEVESAVNFSRLFALGFEGEYDFGVGVGLIESELAELQQLHLHRIPDEFACFLEADDRMIRSHIVEDVFHVLFLFEEIFDINLLVGAVSDCGVELGFVRGDERLEIHEILSQSSCFIEAGEANHASRNDLRLINAKNRFILKSFNSINDSTCHADR